MRDLSSGDGLMRFVAEMELSLGEYGPRQLWVSVLYTSTMTLAYEEAGERIRHFRRAGMVEGVIDSMHVYISERRDK